jgi:hypothetical protein
MAEQEIEAKGVPRQDLDVRLYVLALIALARQLQEEEERSKPAGEGAHA